MLKIRGLVVRFLRSTLMLALIYSLLAGTSIVKAQTASADNYCVQVVNMLPMFDQGVLSVATANVSTGQVETVDSPIATPDSLFSPDGKYAAVWKVLSQPGKISFGDMDLTKFEFGLYLVSVDMNRSVRLFSLRGDEFVTEFSKSSWGWSPDSTKFAYISKDNGQFFINIVNAQNNGKQSKQIAAPKGASKLTDVHFYGWSADNLYLATAAISELAHYNYLAEMNVWTTSNLVSIRKLLNS